MSGLLRADGELEITPESAGWAFSGLRVLELAAGEQRALETGGDELIVLPLAGACTVRVDGEAFELAGRESVFTGITDFAYAPRDASLEIASAQGGRFALPSARADERLPARHVPAEDVPIELRGAGQASRQVNNFCSPEAFAADRLIAVEVLTPAGNWSSYPPHKHDEEVPGVETPLEEIYYYEVAGDGFGFQRVYGSGPGREIEVCEEVRSGDAIVMPHGYHGPSMAAPGYDLYYLWALSAAAGTPRALALHEDPAHRWLHDLPEK
jgi:5-deoxy-glucuronate isomerase